MDKKRTVFDISEDTQAYALCELIEEAIRRTGAVPRWEKTRAALERAANALRRAEK